MQITGDAGLSGCGAAGESYPLPRKCCSMAWKSGLATLTGVSTVSAEGTRSMGIAARPLAPSATAPVSGWGSRAAEGALPAAMKLKDTSTSSAASVSTGVGNCCTATGARTPKVKEDVSCEPAPEHT
jgi:hypothetical protein